MRNIRYIYPGNGPGPVHMITFTPYKLIVCVVAVLSLALTVLTGVNTFSGSTTNLKNIRDLQIDTRQGTVADVLGAVRVLPTNSSSPVYESSSYLTVPSSQESQEAQRQLDALKASIQQIKQQNPSISVARVFGINDFVEHAQGGFRCYSKNSDKDGIDATHLTSGCPMNGALQCLGFHNISLRTEANVYELLVRYLEAFTNLSSAQIDELHSNWTSILPKLNPYSLSVAFPDWVLDTFGSLTCRDDYVYHTYRHGTKQRHVSVPYTMGIVALVFGVLATVCSFYWERGMGVAMIVSLVFVVIHLVFVIVQLALTVDRTKSIKNAINKATLFTAKSTLHGILGSGVFNCVLIALESVCSIMLLISISLYYRTKKVQVRSTKAL